MNFFWVNLGKTYREVLDHNFLWAPAYLKNSKGTESVNAGWKPVPTVRKGDVIFCNANGRLIYTAVATKDAYSSPRPDTRSFEEWSADGYRIDVHLTVLEQKVPHAVFKDEFYDRFNSDCMPMVFTVEREVSQKYMCAISAAAGLLLLKHVSQKDTESIVLSSESAGSMGKVGSSRQTVTKARVGQQAFRREVLAYWQNTCPITGVDLPELLTASHIYPWELSSPQEKVDVFNGLALSPAIDRLFDRGVISFDDSGKLLLNNYFPQSLLVKLGVSPSARLKNITANHAKYLKKHRELFGFN